MSQVPERPWYLRRRAIFAAAVLFGALLGATMAVILASQAPGSDPFERFIGYSLALGIPTAALVGGGSVGIGLLARRVVRSDSRSPNVLASVIAGIATVVVSAGSSLLIVSTIELADFAWIPVAGSLIGGVAFTVWAMDRDRR
jgi:uncharacterized membrane protein